MMPQKAKRLAPTSDTLRELFLKSGNLCAFPNCTHLLMNADGVFIAEVCHIEGAEPGGERFNSELTNEERREFANLMLMCHEHHKVTDDVSKYSVKKLQQIKADHERRFSRPDRAILDKLTDWTTVDQPKNVKNLRRLDSVLGWGSTEEELLYSVHALNDYIDRFKRVPLKVRRFVGAAVTRAHRMQDTRAARYGSSHLYILLSDLQTALQLDPEFLNDMLELLEGYELGDLDEFETDLGSKPGLRIRGLKSGWSHWPDLMNFCVQTSVAIDVFTEDLDFARLDEVAPAHHNKSAS